MNDEDSLRNSWYIVLTTHKKKFKFQMKNGCICIKSEKLENHTGRN